MKTAAERAREHLDRWEKDFNADLDTAVVVALEEHEAEVREACDRDVETRMPGILASTRADERVHIVECIKAYRHTVASLSDDAGLGRDDVPEDIDKLIEEIEGSTT